MMAAREQTEAEVVEYLQRSAGRYSPGGDEYYARVALEQALLASEQGNYGIGAVGTLEPCPMCVCTLTNAGAVRSVSTALDGMIVQEDDLITSDGAAAAIGAKSRLQPRVWRLIQRQQGLRFELLETDDSVLVRLSSEIFLAGREDIDGMLARREGGRRREPA